MCLCSCISPTILFRLWDNYLDSNFLYPIQLLCLPKLRSMNSASEEAATSKYICGWFFLFPGMDPQGISSLPTSFLCWLPTLTLILICRESSMVEGKKKIGWRGHMCQVHTGFNKRKSEVNRKQEEKVPWVGEVSEKGDTNTQGIPNWK